MPNTSNKATDTDSVTPVAQRYRLDLDGVPINLIPLKCTMEKVTTPHQWFMVMVDWIPGEPPKPTQLELNELSRRVLLCQSCGNLRLIK